MKFFRLFILFSLLAAGLFGYEAGSSKPTLPVVKIAVLGSPSVIGRYSQSVYNVALATLIGLNPNGGYTLKRFDITDEKPESIDTALQSIRNEGFTAILAPLTMNGVTHLISVESHLPIFVPTVHKREFPDAPSNIIFGSIDYEMQIKALLPYMSDSVAVFYDNSSIGTLLKEKTESLYLSADASKKKFASYPVDLKGDKIVAYLEKPSLFNRASIVMHMPVVKSSVLAAHLTFKGIKKRNILSTQINVDPTLLTLTQYNDRKSMILANSLVEFPTAIYQSNELMGNDIRFDWVNYTSSVGIDYLVALLTHTERTYPMRLLNAQVIYPVELLHAKEYGFEPL